MALRKRLDELGAERRGHGSREITRRPSWAHVSAGPRAPLSRHRARRSWARVSR